MIQAKAQTDHVEARLIAHGRATVTQEPVRVDVTRSPQSYARGAWSHEMQNVVRTYARDASASTIAVARGRSLCNARWL